MKFLFDECVTPRLVEEATRADYDGTCTRDRGQLGMSDRAAVRLAEEEDRIVVTNDAGDFRELLAAQAMQPGLVVLPLALGIGSAGCSAS